MGDDTQRQPFPPANGPTSATPDGVSERPQPANDALEPSAQPTPGIVASDDDLALELERQARETLRLFRETAGELGARVRQALDQANARWEDTHPGEPLPSALASEHERRARALVRRWTERDFLVDPDLPDAMSAHDLRDGAIWRIEVRERGERRTLADVDEAYTGQRPTAPGPILPPWDYAVETTPDIESGERRERLPGSEYVAACVTCNGSGHRHCATCDGKGFTQCGVCHGRARVPCRRCRGRGVVADPAAERRARADRGYLQVQAERVAAEAGERLADLSERLRQEYGVPLPPSADWLPTAPASGETIPCPDCVNGTTPCDCGNGKRICAACQGTGASRCAICNGSGKVVRHRELVRRFDTRIGERNLPVDDPVLARDLTPEMMRKGVGEVAWEGALDTLAHLRATPEGVPAQVWAATLTFAAEHERRLTHATATNATTGAEPGVSPDDRRVIGRSVSLTRIPLTHIDYSFAEQPYAVLVVGRAGSERFWAQSFPPRWNRIGRFFKAIIRDLQGETPLERPKGTVRELGGVSSFEAFRARRELQTSAESVNQPPNAPNAPNAPTTERAETPTSDPQDARAGEQRPQSDQHETR